MLLIILVFIISIFSLIKICKFLIIAYIKYKISLLRDICIVFKHVCINHIESARSTNMFSIDERNNMLYNINKITNRYNVVLKKLNSIPNDLFRIENEIENSVSLITFCDEINYITIQTSAHELEYIAWFLILEKIKIYKLISIVSSFQILTL